MSEENKAAFRRIVNAFGTGDLSTFDEVIAPQYVEHNPAPGQGPGPEGMKQLATMMRTAFPDLQVTVEDLIAEGDKVVARWTFTGTQQGDLPKVPEGDLPKVPEGDLEGILPNVRATGKQVTIAGITILHIEAGKVVEAHVSSDRLGLRQQLGVIPESKRGRK